MPYLTKSDFIQYLNCPKSLWLKKRKTDLYPKGEFTDFQKKLVRDGYAIEAQVRELIQTRPDAKRFSSQWVFEGDDGLFARADLVRENEDGTLDLFEIKSSTRIKDRAPDFQLKDAAFQAIVAERCGFKVRHIHIVHLNGDYVRDGTIDPEGLVVFADITNDVHVLIPETEREIGQAVALLAQESIDETSCSCLKRRNSSKLKDAVTDWEADLDYLYQTYYLSRYAFGWPTV